MRHLVIVLVVLFCIPCLAQRTLTVALDGSGDFTDIQSAVNAASSGDKILVKSGIYEISQPLRLPSGEFTIRSLSGADNTFIRQRDVCCSDTMSVVVFEIDADHILDGFTIRGGRGNWIETTQKRVGGGIIVSDRANPEIRNCVITDCSAGLGGCVYSVGSPQFYNCKISYGTADTGGGIYCETGSITMENCTLDNHWAASHGGALYLGEKVSQAQFINCKFSDNLAEYGSGVFCMMRSAPMPIFEHCQFEQNKCFEGGAGAGFYSNYSAPLFRFCDFRNNTANVGGGLFLYRSTAIIKGCIISDNWSTGLVAFDSTVMMSTGCLVASNFGYSGGGMRLTNCSGEISDSNISGNGAERGGAAYLVDNTSLLFSKCTLDSNLAKAEGGAVFCSDNADPTFVNSHIMGNESYLNGGAIYADFGAIPTLISTIVVFNKSPEGAIYLRNASGVLWSSTIAYNKGAAVTFNSRSYFQADNSIIWGNSYGIDYPANAEFPPCINYCDIEGPLVWLGAGNINVDPMFVMTPSDVKEGINFENYLDIHAFNNVWRLPNFIQSSALDFMPQHTSPVIDAANCENSPKTDIWGQPRSGAGCDMGAVEYKKPAFIAGDANNDLVVDIADPVYLLNYLFRNGPAPQTLAAADMNKDNTIDIGDVVSILDWLFGQSSSE